jgi:hypothetical protein
MKAFALLLIAWSAVLAAENFDVVVYGGTPGGIASAIAAARLGHTVALIEYHGHIGGMAASGLGKSDIETREAIGGLFREFVGRVYQYYVDKYGAGSENVKLCRDGYYYEPSVAERIFEQMIAGEPRIRLLENYRLDAVIRSGLRVTAIRVKNRVTGALEEWRAQIFIDGTYEGDLAAFAGAGYRLGREGRAEFNELYAGVVYLDVATRAFLAGTTGEGDRRMQAYTFRLCLTSDPANSYVLRDPPPSYDRSRYLGYFEDVKAGRMDAPKDLKEGRGYFAPFFGTVVRALSLVELPNNKTDINMNPRVHGFPFAEENDDYPEADWDTREKITEKIRNLTLGLLYFLQNDSQVPAAHRRLANRYHLAKDEFTDNNHFPWQLYVREARRIRGEYTLSENDLVLVPGLGRARIHKDSIAAGEFPIDSFPVRKREPGRDAPEGYIYMLDRFTQPYQIPYRVMVPEQVDGLLAPVPASTTHVAFSTIRLEPTWMALGQAAGTAAHLAIATDRHVRSVDVDLLQRLLLRQGQVLTYFKDIDGADPAYAALQYLGTKGFFANYYVRSRDRLDAATAAEWAKRASDLGVAAAPAPSPGMRRGDYCRALYARIEAAGPRK